MQGDADTSVLVASSGDDSGELAVSGRSSPVSFVDLDAVAAQVQALSHQDHSALNRSGDQPLQVPSPSIQEAGSISTPSLGTHRRGLSDPVGVESQPHGYLGSSRAFRDASTRGSPLDLDEVRSSTPSHNPVPTSFPNSTPVPVLTVLRAVPFSSPSKSCGACLLAPRRNRGAGRAAPSGGRRGPAFA